MYARTSSWSGSREVHRGMGRARSHERGAVRLRPAGERRLRSPDRPRGRPWPHADAVGQRGGGADERSQRGAEPCAHARGDRRRADRARSLPGRREGLDSRTPHGEPAHARGPGTPEPHSCDRRCLSLRARSGRPAGGGAAETAPGRAHRCALVGDGRSRDAAVHARPARQPSRSDRPVLRGERAPGRRREQVDRPRTLSTRRADAGRCHGRQARSQCPLPRHLPAARPGRRAPRRHADARDLLGLHVPPPGGTAGVHGGGDPVRRTSCAGSRRGHPARLARAGCGRRARHRSGTRAARPRWFPRRQQRARRSLARRASRPRLRQSAADRDLRGRGRAAAVRRLPGSAAASARPHASRALGRDPCVLARAAGPRDRRGHHRAGGGTRAGATADGRPTGSLPASGR